MAITGEVYGLYCDCDNCGLERTEGIRYVGVTVEGIEKRLRKHLVEARTESEKAKDRWIRKHGSESIRTQLLETVTTSHDDLRVAEIAWIAKLKTFGPGGLNMTRGGEGVWGYKFSDDVKGRFRERTAQQMAVKHPRAKINEAQAVEIIQRIWGGETTSAISRDYAISTSAIQRIRSGLNWPHLPRPEGPPPSPLAGNRRRSKRVSEDIKAQIKSENRGGWGELKRLAEKFGLSEATISLVLNGHRD